QQFEALGAGGRVARVVEIDQGDVEALPAQRLQRGGWTVDAGRRESFGLEQQAQGFAYVAEAVDDEDPALLALSRHGDAPLLRPAHRWHGAMARGSRATAFATSAARLQTPAQPPRSAMAGSDSAARRA